MTRHHHHHEIPQPGRTDATSTPNPESVMPVELSSLDDGQVRPPLPDVPLPRGSQTPGIDVLEQSAGATGASKAASGPGPSPLSGSGMTSEASAKSSQGMPQLSYSQAAAGTKPEQISSSMAMHATGGQGTTEQPRRSHHHHHPHHDIPQPARTDASSTPTPDSVMPVELSSLDDGKVRPPLSDQPLPRGTQTPAIDVLERGGAEKGPQMGKGVQEYAPMSAAGTPAGAAAKEELEGWQTSHTKTDQKGPSSTPAMHTVVVGQEKRPGAIGGGAATTGEALEQTAKQAVGRAGEVAGQAKQAAGKAGENIKESAGRATEQAKQAAGRTAETIKESAGRAAETGSPMYESAKQTAGQAAGKAMEVGGRAGESIKETAGRAAETAQETGSKAYEAAKETAGRAAETAAETGSKAYEAAKETAGRAAETGSRALETAKETGSKAYEAAKETAGRAAETAKETGAKAYSTAARAADTVTGTASHALESARSTAAAATESVTGTASQAYQGTKSAVGTATGYISSAASTIGKVAEDARQVAVAGVEAAKEFATGKPAVPEEELGERSLASSAADLASGLAESAKSSAQKVLSLPSQAVGKVSESMFPSQSAIVSELEHSKELHGMRAGQVGSRVDIEEFAVTEGNPSAAVQVEEITLMEGTPGGVAVSEQSGEFIRKRAQVDREIVKESGPRAA